MSQTSRGLYPVGEVSPLEISYAELAAGYREMDDAALTAVAADAQHLTPEAQQALQAELASRHFDTKTAVAEYRANECAYAVSKTDIAVNKRTFRAPGSCPNCLSSATEPVYVKSTPFAGSTSGYSFYFCNACASSIRRIKAVKTAVVIAGLLLAFACFAWGRFHSDMFVTVGLMGLVIARLNSAISNQAMQSVKLLRSFPPNFAVFRLRRTRYAEMLLEFNQAQNPDGA